MSQIDKFTDDLRAFQWNSCCLRPTTASSKSDLKRRVVLGLGFIYMEILKELVVSEHILFNRRDKTV